ncbi:sialate O-acetylesterase [Caldithrix abyssi]
MRHIFVYLNILFLALAANAQQVTFSKFPAHLQLFPRDNQDSAVVQVAGNVLSAGYQKIALKIYRDTVLWKQMEQNLDYAAGEAPFSFSPKIFAGLYEYRFEVWLDNQKVAEEDSIVCGDVFLINGQSNSHPGATTYSFQSEFCRSFGKHTNYDDYNPADTTWGLSTPEGWCSDCDYAVGVWGLRLQQMILEKYGMPTCIINGGSGGSSISYNLPDSNDHMNLSTTYGRLLYRATKAHVQNAVKAIFWHQGESDSYTPDADYYAARFDTLYNAWRQDYQPLTKVYVFQLHPGTCGGDRQSDVREIQRNFKKTYGNVHVMATCGLVGHDGCHYNDDGYLQMAEWIFRLVERDFYGATDTLNIEAPDIKEVYYQDADHRSIAIEYDQPVIWPDDTLNQSMKNYFYLDDEFGYVKQGYTINNGYTVVLDLTTSMNAALLTYLPNATYNRLPTMAYEGPWIRNERGVGALSFYHVPINAGPSAISESEALPEQISINTYPNPANAGVRIEFELVKSTPLTIAIFDVNGRKVATLASRHFPAGKHHLLWNASAENDQILSSGTYWIRFKTNDFEKARKIVLIK